MRKHLVMRIAASDIKATRRVLEDLFGPSEERPFAVRLGDSIVDAGAPSQRYNDEIINDQFYLDRGSPGQDPSVVPVSTRPNVASCTAWSCSVP